MVEVIVAAVLFAVSAAGIFATITYTRPSAVSDSRIKAALYSKKVLDSLNKAVEGATWDSGLLSVGSHNWPADAEFTGYTATYTVSDAGGARKVVVNIHW